MPPANAYGVATFYALFALEPRPRRVVHVLRRHRVQVSRLGRADRRARSWLRTRRATVGGRVGHVASQPLPGPVRPHRRDGGGRGRRSGARPGAPVDGGTLRGPWRGASRGRRRRAAPAGRRSVAPAPAPSRSRSTHEPRRVPGARRLRRAQASLRAGTGGRPARGEGLRSSSAGAGRLSPPVWKWEAVARQPARPHYLVCNADEGRARHVQGHALLEGDPFAVVEAMTVARTRPAASEVRLHPGRCPEARRCSSTPSPRPVGAGSWATP